MTPVVWGLVAIAVAVLLLAWAIGRAAAAVVKAMHEKPVTSPVHTDIAKHVQRVAVAAETMLKADKTEQEKQHVAGVLENVLHGIHTTLDADFTSDPGLRPDIIAGQARGVDVVKTHLREQLATALK